MPKHCPPVWELRTWLTACNARERFTVRDALAYLGKLFFADSWLSRHLNVLAHLSFSLGFFEDPPG